MFDFLAYSEDSPTGLVWTGPSSPLSRVKKGQVAGCKEPTGYWCVTIKRKRFYSHRVVWELNHGPIPEGLVIDHIDRNKRNNRIENLRLVTAQQNCYNRTRRLRKFTRRRGDQWIAYFVIPKINKYVHVGVYDTEQEAHIAAISRRLELYWAI